MNFGQILSSGGLALSALALAGVPIPASLLATIEKAAPLATAVTTIMQNPPTNIHAAISDLATAAGAIEATGLASADSEIAIILGEVKKYTASISNFESGQVAIVANYNVSINGVSKAAYVATFIEGGAAASALGL